MRRHARTANTWNRINRVLAVLVSVGFLAVLALWFLPELQKREKMSTELAKKKSELAAEQLRRRQMEREKYLLENDPEYIEAIARDRLDLMKTGETIFRLDPPTVDKPPPAPGQGSGLTGRNHDR